jgi:hypothetical protein
LLAGRDDVARGRIDNALAWRRQRRRLAAQPRVLGLQLGDAHLRRFKLVGGQALGDALGLRISFVRLFRLDPIFNVAHEPLVRIVSLVDLASGSRSLGSSLAKPSVTASNSR